MYDRISERRLAQEAAEREAAEKAAFEAANPPPSAPIVVPLQKVASTFGFAGLALTFPQGFEFHDIETTLYRDGEPVKVSIQRRASADGDTVESHLEKAATQLALVHPQWQVICRRDCLLAGSRAVMLDFHFKAGFAERHGRLVGGLLPVAGTSDKQWLSICTAIDPTKPGLSLWLLEFDGMLQGLAPA